MFRGNPTRNFTGHGQVPRTQKNIKELWRYGPIAGPPKFTGVGWTGQPLIIDWPLKYREMMKWNKPFQKISVSLWFEP